MREIGSMATNFEYDDEFDDLEEGTDVVKQLRKVNRELAKRSKELETELTALRTQTRQRTIKDVLQAKGVNPKIAAFIPQDIEVSDEAVSNWLNEYGDVFGFQPDAQSEQPSASAVDVSGQARINNVVSTGQAPDVDADVMNKILAASTPEELNRVLGISL